MHLGTNLQYLRKRSNNMTQEKLAERMGVSRQTVSKWESGENVPELSKLTELCALFSCSLDALIQEDLAVKAAASSSVRILRVPGFRYAFYTVISRHAREDANAIMDSRHSQMGIRSEETVPIGWAFPYLSQEQKQRHRLSGYVSARILPEDFASEISSVEISCQTAAEYAVLTVADPFAEPQNRISQAYATILSFLDANNIRKQHKSGILPCFERVYQKNGICYMDVYVHCQGGKNAEPIQLSEL